MCLSKKCVCLSKKCVSKKNCGGSCSVRRGVSCAETLVLKKGEISHMKYGDQTDRQTKKQKDCLEYRVAEHPTIVDN